MRRRLLLVTLAALSVGGCSADESEAPASPGQEAASTAPGSTPHLSAPTASGTTGSAGDSDAGADDAFLLALQQKLTVPPMPAFAIPTDLVTSEQDRRLAERLELEPGLYQGIAVVDVRCDADGNTSAADSGAADVGVAGHFDDGVRTITVGGDGTGVYDAPDLHIAVLDGGAGVYDDGTTRVSVQADGAGTFSSGDRRYTVRADGSGSYSDGASRIWVGPDGAGGYDDDDLHVTLNASGEVFGDGDASQVASVASVLRDGLPAFPPVPLITRVTPTGTSCGSVIRLDANVLFDFDAATLQPEAAALLGRVATLLVTLGSPAVQVAGHTDQLGDEAYNLRLSRERADVVRAALVSGGVAAGSLTALGLGETEPLRAETGADGQDDPAARQLNRRVELLLLD